MSTAGNALNKLGNYFGNCIHIFSEYLVKNSKEKTSALASHIKDEEQMEK